MIKHKRPTLVRRLSVCNSGLGAVQIRMSEVYSCICDCDHYALSGVPSLPCVVSTVYLTAANRLRLESRRRLERHRVIGFGCILGVQYSDDTGDSWQLVEDTRIHPESPVVDLSVDRVDSN